MKFACVDVHVIDVKLATFYVGTFEKHVFTQSVQYNACSVGRQFVYIVPYIIHDLYRS